MPLKNPWRRHLSRRRALLVLPSLAFAALLTILAVSVVRGGPERGALDWAILAPFLLIMTWESFVVWQLVLGFAAWARGPRGLSALERRAAAIEPVSTGRSRTALLLPIYEEDAPAVFSALRVMAASLARTGAVDDVDVHVLSDTQDPVTAAAEGREHQALLAWSRVAGGALPSVAYRRRLDNSGRKAGNVAEFLERRADDYDFMIVLDADSLMSGETMRRLIRLMEENERIGAIQTISYATGRDTLFARIQQFAVRLYAPLALRGLEFWQGPDGTYWGHNAILRCAPFRDHCRLPVLSGRPPFGGEILCHDTVEAALLRRAGWEIHILTEIEGTWEEMPTNVIDLLGRERRWCQGNLQHSRVVGTPGFLPGSRAHLLLGIMGYLTAPVWWAFLLLAAIRAVIDSDGQGLGVVAYGLTEPGPAAAGLVAFAAALILLPRVLNLLRVLGDRRDRRNYGGTGRLLLSAAAEQLYWILLGPMLSFINAGFVLQTFAGRIVRWDAQPRADRTVSWGEAARVLALPTGIGVALAAAALHVGGWYGVWMAPTALGLILGPALTVWSSRIDLGHLSRRWGLFLTRDDTAPAPEIVQSRSGRPGAVSVEAVAPPMPAAPERVSA